jgi:hypothetical protein
MVENRTKEQLSLDYAIDKSENYGISTNLHIISEYINNLFKYV